MGADVARLDAHGVKHLVSLMAGQDILDAGMGSLESVLLAKGIQWSHLPILCGAEYDEFFERELIRFAKEIRPAVIAGESIAIHSDGWGTGFKCHLPKILMALDSNLSFEIAQRIVLVGLCYQKAVYG